MNSRNLTLRVLIAAIVAASFLTSGAAFAAGNCDPANCKMAAKADCKEKCKGGDMSKCTTECKEKCKSGDMSKCTAECKDKCTTECKDKCKDQCKANTACAQKCTEMKSASCPGKGKS